MILRDGSKAAMETEHGFIYDILETPRECCGTCRHASTWMETWESSVECLCGLKETRKLAWKLDPGCESYEFRQKKRDELFKWMQECTRQTKENQEKGRTIDQILSSSYGLRDCRVMELKINGKIYVPIFRDQPGEIFIETNCLECELPLARKPSEFHISLDSSICAICRALSKNWKTQVKWISGESLIEESEESAWLKSRGFQESEGLWTNDNVTMGKIACKNLLQIRRHGFSSWKKWLDEDESLPRAWAAWTETGRATHADVILQIISTRLSEELILEAGRLGGS